MDKKTILIVDDEATNIDILISFLSNNYHIKVAKNGKKALDVLNGSNIDLILLDIVMPDMDGYELASIIKKDEKLLDIPFIFLTAKDDSSSLAKGFELGAIDYITKPFVKEKLEQRIKIHIKQIELKNTLKDNEFMWRNAIEANGDGLWDWYLQDNKLYFSPEYQKMLGYEYGEFEETLENFKEHLHPDYLDYVFKETHAYLNSEKQFYEVKFKMRCKDGSYKWIFAKGSLVQRDSNGEPFRMLGTHRDITPQKELEEKLSESNLMLSKRYEEELKLRQELESYKTELENKVKKEVEKNRQKDRILHDQSKNAQMGEMIGMIAHQWRQPLNSISASAIGISLKSDMGVLTDEDLKNHIEFVQKSVQNMSQIIDDFMNFFKPENHASIFSTNQLMDETLSIIGSQLKGRGIEVRYNKNTNIKINGYRKELSHVLLNLIANARDAYENSKLADKFIDIDFIDDKNHVSITVKDYAGGIPQDVADRIFNPYFTTKEQGKGTGIGLHMSRRIIQEIFKGSLEFQNVDGGAEFIISFGTMF